MHNSEWGAMKLRKQSMYLTHVAFARANLPRALSRLDQDLIDGAV